MLKIENVEVVGWVHAIRGMRNPMNSWEKSDSECLFHALPNYSYDDPKAEEYTRYLDDYNLNLKLGPNDYALMKKLLKAGTDHRKFMRMITVYLDITAPLYWWKEFKTYRAGRNFGDPEPDIIDPELLEMDIETNSCSTMHKIHAKEFAWNDFSTEHLIPCRECALGDIAPTLIMDSTIKALNFYRKKYLETKDKKYWWQMIQLLPSSYNQKRTVMLNYEVLANIYKSRRNHRLDEWHVLCDWIESLPYSELIIGNSLEDIPICKEIMSEAKRRAKEDEK